LKKIEPNGKQILVQEIFEINFFLQINNIFEIAKCLVQPIQFI